MKIILFTIFLLLIISLLAIYQILISFDPYKSSFAVSLSLYFSLMIFLGSLFTFLIFWTKIRFIDQGKISQAIWPSIRQGFLLGLCLVIMLVLAVTNLLNYWELFSIIFAFLFIELFFQSEKTFKSV